MLPLQTPTTSLPGCRHRDGRRTVRAQSSGELQQPHASRRQDIIYAFHSIILRRSFPLATLAALFAATPSVQASGGGPGTSGTGGSGGEGGGVLRFFAPASGSAEPVTLTLASFAVTKMAYVRLTRRFREAYLANTGVDVRFRLTFAGSGVQARAVIDGLPADIVALALALDVEKVSQAGLIDPGWQMRYPNNSIVCETTVAFVVRSGNPKNILEWPDLIREDVQVVVANPKTAGVARWIFLALWGHKMRKGRGDDEPIDYVTKVFENVVVQPRDAREASDVFYKQRVGDVLLTYENEVILTNLVYGEKALPYVVPKTNVRIECPVAVVDSVVRLKDERTQKAADAFVKFLFTAEAQTEFGNVGFRINPKVAKDAAEQQVGLPDANLWTVDKELGGWEKAQARFFDSGTILDRIQNDVGQRKAEARKALAAARK